MKKYSVRKEIAEKTGESLNAYPEILRQMLFYRGIEKDEDAEKFLNPDYEGDTKIISGSEKDWNKLRMHHLQIFDQDDGKYFFVTDGYTQK